jgi:hypothetical protein
MTLNHNTLILTQFLLKNLNRNNWYYKYRIISLKHKITHLFFVKKHTSKLLKNNWEVFLMNCIYKTNKYKLLLFVIVDHIFLSIISYVDFAFLTRETEENFAWVLKTLQKYLKKKNILVSKILMTNRDVKLINVSHSIFSRVRHFLCIWHVNKNVLTHCKSYFITKEEWEKLYLKWQAMM